MNALFFLSLVLSLAAAFFGILAKQWLREYVQWNSPLGEPRENVLVRQVRFEAWELWNVAATISSVPALLELAMVLFLVGVVVLLCTIDDVVAIVVTIAIVAFLSLAVASTVLPVFLTRCPSKSPTAWACVATVQFISQLLSSVYFKSYAGICGILWKLFGSSQFLYVWVADRPQWQRLRHWRGRDLQATYSLTIKVGGWWSKPLDLKKAVRMEMKGESKPFVTQSNTSDLLQFLNDDHDWLTVQSQLDQKTEVLRDIGHASWIQTTQLGRVS